MRIVNIMLSSGGGGIQQAFLDYSIAMHSRDHKLLAVIVPNATVEHELKKNGIAYQTLENRGQWDLFARLRLRKMLRKHKTDVVIAHGNRAISFACPAAKGFCPVVAPAHNYQTKRFTKVDGVFATTRDMVDHLVMQGVQAERIFQIPNMVMDVNSFGLRYKNDVPVIAAMGRFVEKKGFHVLLEALHILHDREIPFKAVIGGEGEEEKKLKKQLKKLDLEEHVHFPGWINDKRGFFQKADVFCVPSLHEPFGIVLLEAFTYGVPVVCTNTEGPSDIARDGKEAVFCIKGNAESLAEGLLKVMRDEALQDSLIQHGRAVVDSKYAMPVVAEKMEAVFEQLQRRYTRTQAA